MKAIRWLLKLVLAMITLPLILAVWLIKWFVVFLHHCSAWTFYLLGSVVLATAVLSFLMQQLQGIEALQMLIGGFVIFMIPQVVGGVVVGRTKDQILSDSTVMIEPFQMSCRDAVNGDGSFLLNKGSSKPRTD